MQTQSTQPGVGRKSLGVIAILIAIVSAVVLVAQDPSTVRLDSDVPVQDVRFVEYMAAVTDSPSTQGDRYEVLVNGDRALSAMLDAIRSAKRRVNFVTYIYEEGTVASQFTDALADARRRGVEVNVVVDAFGAAVPRDHLKRLEEAGCTVTHFHPFRWYALQEASYRNHRKILVVDGRTAFTGGMGVADHWLGNAQDKDHWRDTQFLIEGPAVRYLEAAFYENLAESQEGALVTPRIGPHDDATPPSPAGGAQSIVVASGPSGGVGGVKRLFLLSIAAARHTIDIQTPYFITDDSTDWALEEARRRGVRIRLLVESDMTDAKPVKWASRAAYEELLRDGLEIYEYEPTMMHAKTMIVDGLWSIVGSANFDNRSLDMNEEMNVGIADPALARVLTEVFADDLRLSRRVTMEEWRKRSRLQKVHDKFWSLFGELF